MATEREIHLPRLLRTRDKAFPRNALLIAAVDIYIYIQPCLGVTPFPAVFIAPRKSGRRYLELQAFGCSCVCIVAAVVFNITRRMRKIYIRNFQFFLIIRSI